jgi:GntR family transcriptional regulator, rspAB operon transcriptional repressor
VIPPSIVPAASAPRALKTSSLREIAYREIRARILRAEYEPGLALSEYQIATALALSRTPVREALKQLEQEGLVRSVPKRGVFVTELTVTDIDEIYQIREQLEVFAARVAAESMADDEVDELAAQLERAMQTSSITTEAFQADIHLHEAIIASTRNVRLAQILATLSDQVHRIRALSPRSPGRLNAALEEHVAIVESLKRRDPDAAASAMRIHLEHARDNAVQLLRPSRVGGLRRRTDR